ncbi:hypothetical protein M758_4G261500 [Ceratodon purpureus]|nr:hypothetical protein M758_4G261500 [Ceratodon purpureus]
MEQLKKMSQYEEAAPGNNGLPGEHSRSPKGIARRGSQKLGTLLLRRDSDSDNERVELSHEPMAMQLTPKSSLLGVQITDDDEALFFSRRSAMSAMISDNFRSNSSGSTAPIKREAETGKRKEQPKRMDSTSLLPPPGSGRTHSGVLQSQPGLTANGDHTHSSGHTMMPINAEGSRLPSGLLYPCSNPGGNPNSCLLNAAHFTFDSAILSPDPAGAGGSNNLTERIFKKLMGQSKLHRSNSKSGSPAGDESKSPNSTLDCPTSPASSERSFRGKSKKKSLRCRSEDANTVVAANPRPKSQLAQYLRSMTAMSGDHAIDDDDLEGPSEAAWLDPDSPYHPNRQEVDRYASTPGNSKKKPTLESWSSNSSSWNLSLVQNPLKTVSTIVGRRHREHGSTPGRSIRKGSRFGNDTITHISLTGSYDGSSARSRGVRKGNGSEVSSGRSWWSEIGSGRKSTSIWACSGRLQAEASAEPDLHEPDMEQRNNVKNRVVQRQVERAKVDEEAFPFNNPVASSFVFREAEKSQSSPDAAPRGGPVDRITLHKTTVSGTDSDDLQYSDAYHDPEDGSITDSDASHRLSLDRDGPNGALNHAPQWDSARSFDYVGVVGLSSRGMSSRALSGFLEMGRSGRFSVDLNRGQKLDKAQHLPTPDVRLRIFASEKSSKRSILSPCLPFLQRSPHKNVPRIQQAPSTGSSRRIQAVNSFTARLGPVAENPTLAGQFHVQ